MKRFSPLLVLLLGRILFAQVTVATGDTRTIAQPTYPTGCTKFAATKYLVQTTTVNQDPYNATCVPFGTMTATMSCGTTGGTSFEPSSLPSSYVAAETLDTAFKTAIAGTLTNNCLELTQGASGQKAIVLPEWSVPAGVKLLLDAGTSIKASRNPSDYTKASCGTLNTANSTSCSPWLTIPGANSGIYGLGILDGRGWDKFTTGATTQSFYYQRLLTYCVSHSGTIAGSPTCPAGLPSYQKSYGPTMLEPSGASNLVIYKTSFRDAGGFIFNWVNGNGFTGWGMKLIAPFEVSNTDGFDPLNSSNGTFTQGIISAGDNPVAAKATSSAVQNVTVSNSQIGAGVGTGLGTDLRKGITNMLFNGLLMNGNLHDSRQVGFQLISDATNNYGGPVNKLTWQNICMRNEGRSALIQIAAGDFTTPPTPPSVNNLLLRNVTVLPSTAPYTTGNSGTFTFQGYSGNQNVSQVDNFQILGTNQGNTNSYNNVYLGPGAVTTSLKNAFTGGTGNTVSDHTSATSPFACTNAMFAQLNGELNVKTSTSNYNQSVTFGSSTPFTLEAVLQPTTEINNKEQPALTAPISFYDNCVGPVTGCTPISSAALTGDGFYAPLAVSSITAGTHNYFAYYPGDSFYSPFQFGMVTVVNGSPTSPVTIKSSGAIKISGTISIL